MVQQSVTGYWQAWHAGRVVAVAESEAGAWRAYEAWLSAHRTNYADSEA